MAQKREIPSIDWFDGRINALIAGYADRKNLYDKIDQSIHGEWNMPQDLVDLGWAFKQVELIFRQAIAAAMRILADVQPRISIVPASTQQKDLNIADSHEKALDWLLSAASRRREATVVEDVVESAVRYSEVCHEVVFLPEQIKNVEAAGGNANRYKAMLRRGDFSIVSHHPGNVFPRYSDMGVEEVGLEEIMDPLDVIDLYGSAADGLKSYLRAHPNQRVQCTLRTYHSYDYRAVYARLGPPPTKSASTQGARQALPQPLAPGGELFEIAREEWKWPFLPWVARFGGSSVETRSDMKRRALLSDSVYGNQFETLNRVKTLRFSEMVRYAGSEKQVFKSGSRTEPDSTQTSASPRVHIEEDEDLQTLQPPIPDPGMGLLYGELRADVQKSTLSEILFGGNIPVGAAFATINLVTHSAMAVLKEPKRVAENAIADTLELMLLWAHYSQKNLVGYGVSDEGKRMEYLIKYKDINPANLYITVELAADVPTDRQARMLAATQGVQAGVISRARAREEVGVHNAKDEEDMITKERIWDTIVNVDLQNEMYMGSIEAQDQMRQKVMEELMKNPEQLVQILQQLTAKSGGAPPPAGDDAGMEAAMGGPGMAMPGQGGGELPATPGAGMGMPSDEMMGGAGGAGMGGMSREEQSGQTQGGIDIGGLVA